MRAFFDRDFRPYLLWVSSAVVLLSIAAALPSFAIVLGLPPEGDAADYRLPMIKWMVRHQQYPSWPWTTAEDCPMLGEVVMAFFYWINPHLTRLVPLFSYIGLGWVAYGFCKVLRPEMPAMIGAAWIMALRPLAIQSNLLMVDNVASFFTLASLLFLIKMQARTAAIFFAFALASRYTAWSYSPALLLAAFVIYLPQKKIRPIFEFMGISALGAFPNLIRNFYVNEGNPFFPFLTSVFNKVPIDIASRGFFPGIGRGKSITDFLMLPYDILYTNTFVNGFFDYTVGKLFYLQIFTLLTALVWVLIRKQKITFPRIRPTRTNVAIASFAFAHLVIWFLSSQQMRYLVPFMVLVNLAMLFLLWDFRKPLLLLFVTACACFSIASIQKDSILMALGRKESIFTETGNRALKCFQNSAVQGKVVGFIDRDGVLGYLDVDFVFYPPSGYATPLSFFMHAPEFIFYPRPLPGLEEYEALPGSDGCFLRRKKA